MLLKVRDSTLLNKFFNLIHLNNVLYLLKRIFDLNKFYILIFASLFLINTRCSENPADENNPEYAEYTQIDYEPSLSGNGEAILYVHTNPDMEYSGIYLFNIKNNTDSLVITGVARSPDWSPDGTRLVYTFDNFLYTVKTDGDSLTEIANAGRNLYAKWSGNGMRIAFSQTDCGNSSECGIYVTDFNGNNKIFIERNAGYPEWTDSGNVLIYFKSAGNQGGDSLIRYSLVEKTRSLIEVFKGEEHFRNSYLNYSGGDVIFCSTDSEGYSYIYSYSTATSELTKLTSSQGWSPNCPHNSDQIIYTNRTPGNGRLYIMNKDGSNQRQLFQ